MLFLKTKKSKLHPIGFDVYPYTKKDFTYFEITAYKDLIEEVLSAVSSMVLPPDFTENNFKVIKKIVSEEIMEFYDNPYDVLNQKVDQFLYQKNSLALNVAGRKKSIKNITIADLKKWYKKYYIPNNMILTLVGNINVNKTTKLINNIFHFNHLPDKTEKKKKISKIIYPKILTKPIKFTNYNFQQAYLAFVFSASGINNLEYIYNILLAELLNKKMRQKLENSGLFYDIELDYHQYLNAGEFRIITSCDKKNVNKITEKFMAFVYSVKISENFFEEVKNYIRYQFMLKEDSVDELSSLSLYLLAGRLKPLTVEDEIKKVKNISYKKMREIKKKIFNKNNCYFFVMN